MVTASGRIPQLSLVLGPTAGGGAYGPALTDVVVLAPEGRIFVTGPDVVKSVTGDIVDMALLGGPEAHSKNSGVAQKFTHWSMQFLIKMARRLSFLICGLRI
jgi:acetyl-CoA/propionyl-CoA carboxylase carboxyl transferase subunit